DCNKARMSEIIKKLSMYKLRSDVKIEAAEYEPYALIGDKAFEVIGSKTEGAAKIADGNIIYIDPRSAKIYSRAIIKKGPPLPAGFEPGAESDYNEIRINACIPEADVDMLSTVAYPLHFNMNELNAVDYKKGCYVGQEVTARMNNRDAIRKKLYVADLNSGSTLPAAGAEVTDNGEKIGTALSATNSTILCVLVIEKVEKQNKSYKVGDSEITIRE
ncbi:MAG: putative global regulator, partial [Rickettsiaceae bacterium]|nr:putative global regulator [Rickettsiaceae bacterium]